jgi:hypothetical protein
VGRWIQHLDPIFKNAAFDQEAEWRIILLELHGLPKEETPYERNFRFTENDIIKHYDLCIGDSIRAVRIGPLCRAIKGEVSAFLESLSLQSIQVSSSIATLQAKGERRI